MIPQSISDRYIHTLIDAGITPDFRLDSLTCQRWCVEEAVCGFYYRAGVIHGDTVLHDAVGATPFLAVKNALAKAGVTFR